MAIHHDKLAYGKLKGTREELSEEQIAEMLKRMREEEPDGGISADGETDDAPERRDGKK